MKHIYNFEKLACVWCEKYGIIDYNIRGSNLVYYKNYYDDYVRETYTTYKVTVDLRTMTETRTALKRRNRNGWYNV